MKKYIMLAATICCTLTTSLFTSCTEADNPVPQPVVVDDKPFPYDSEIDESVRPGDDFYRYALGKWLDSSNPSPSFFEQIKKEYADIRDNALASSNDPLLVLLRSQADATLADDGANLALLKERLQMLEQIQTVDQLYAGFGVLQQMGYSTLFRLLPMVGGDKIVNCYFTSGGTTEEMRQVFYRREQNKVDNLVATYCQPLLKLGFSEERLQQIIANASTVEMQQFDIYIRGIEMLSHPVKARLTRSVSENTEKIMTMLMMMMGISNEQLNTGYFQIPSAGLLQFFADFASVGDDAEQIARFRDYMIYNVIAQDAPFIPSITGAKRPEMLSRALQYNRYYKYRQLVEYYGYDNIFKQQCSDIMEQMRQIFIQRVGNLDWMGTATKAEARIKAEKMKFYIGYPNQWNDDLTPHANGDCLLASVTQLRQQATEITRGMAGKKIDDITWDLWAQIAEFTTDNAFYLASANALVILPAWITRPRFNADLSEATLYATAVTFGHEFCHGFDANGSRSDADGASRDWWEPADKQAFEAKQQILIQLYNQLEAYPGQSADGEKTLRENMADYGGVELALDCYRQRLTQQGFKGEQFDEQIKKFFLSYAETWKNERELSLEQLMHYHNIDDHSLCHNRVNGMMRLQDDWYRLYDVKPTDKLYLAPEDRVKIW